MTNIVIEAVKELLWPHRPLEAIPSLDGPWAPDDRLDEMPLVADGLGDPTDIVAHDGHIHVAEGRSVFRLSGPARQRKEEVARFEADVHGVSTAGAFGIAACVAGRGIAFVGGHWDGRKIDAVDGRPLACPTAALLLSPNTLVIADASTRENGAYRRDYLETARSGRLIKVNLDTGRAATVIDGLGYPTSLALARDGYSLLVAEAWAHRISHVDPSAEKPVLQAKLQNLPGFPWRILRTAGGYWLSFLCLRTQLLEFVRSEAKFRAQMIEATEPEFWIAPAPRTTGHFYEPVQGGQIKQHGVTKPWAPTRSYGLLARLGSDLEPLETWHSRHGRQRHGLTGLAEVDGRLMVLARGPGAIFDAGLVRGREG